MIAFSFIDHIFLLRTATYINYSLKREGKHLPSINRDSHSQTKRPSSRQMRIWAEREMWTKSMAMTRTTWIIGKLLQTTARTRHRATSPQPCAPWEIFSRDYRDMDTFVDLGPCNPCNSIRCEDIAQGISTKRHFVLSYIYIPVVLQEPLAPPSYVAVLLAKAVSPSKETLQPLFAMIAPVMQERGAHAIKLLE